jgi:hypothetical protein
MDGTSLSSVRPVEDEASQNFANNQKKVSFL